MTENNALGSSALRLTACLCTLSLALAFLAGDARPASAQACAYFAYIPNYLAGTVSVIDTSNDSVVATIQVGTWPLGVAVHPDGTFVYVSNEADDTVSVIDTATLTVTATIAVGHLPTGIAVHPTGTFVYVANSGDGTLDVILTSNNSLYGSVAVQGWPVGVAVAQNGDTVYVANAGSNTVSVVDSQSLTVQDTVAVGEFPDSMAVDPQGDLIYVGNHEDNSLSVIQRPGHNVIATVPVGNHPHDVAVHPDSTFIYVANDLGHTVSVIERDTWVEKATVSITNPQAITVHPEGDRVYVTGFTTDSVSVIGVASNTVVDVVQVGNGPWGLGLFIACDKDIDNDGCFNDVDQHPDSSLARSGRIMPGPTCPSGVAQDKFAYEGSPVDTDGDGVLNCADFDDDNDGLCDDNETLGASAPGISPQHMGCVGPDPCPLHDGDFNIACQEITICPEMPPWWVNCKFAGAGCFELLVKLDSLINPDPTTIFDTLEIVGQTLYVTVAGDMSVLDAADLLCGGSVGGRPGTTAGAVPAAEGSQGGGFRLELWMKGDAKTEERFVALIAEYRAEDVEFGSLEGGRVLAIEPTTVCEAAAPPKEEEESGSAGRSSLWVNAVRAPGAPPVCVPRPGSACAHPSAGDQPARGVEAEGEPKGCMAERALD